MKQVTHQVVIQHPLMRAKTSKAVGKGIAGQTWWPFILQTPLQRARVQVKVDEVLMREQHISRRLAAQIVPRRQQPARVNDAYLFRRWFIPTLIINWREQRSG